MNALRVLMGQHDRIEGLLVDLGQVAKRGEQSRGALLAVVARELRRHFELEETIFYAALEKRLILISEEPFLVEHRRVLAMLEALETAAPENFDSAYHQLHQALVAHVSDEEIELFPEVKRRLSVDELDELGARIEELGLGPPVTGAEGLGYEAVTGGGERAVTAGGRPEASDEEASPDELEESEESEGPSAHQP